MRRFSAIFLLLFATACTDGTGKLWPTPLWSRSFPPPGPPNYQQGMMDGCETAQGAVGSSVYAAVHSGIHYDVDKALNDKVYYKAWKDGYFYCKYEHDKGPE